MKTYRLEMPLFGRVMPFFVLVFLTTIPPIAMFKDPHAMIILLPFLAILLWNWYVLLTMAYRIDIGLDGTLEWVALARTVKMAPEEIREISPDMAGSIGFFSAKTDAAKVRFINQITGFHEVVAHIKSRNPSVVLKGC
jgi:hypothetical protein